MQMFLGRKTPITIKYLKDIMFMFIFLGRKTPMKVE